MDLSNLTGFPDTQKKRKRVGRGHGSGHGKTSGRGHKGQGARAGGGPRPGFEGGQMPLQRRIPKRGFHNPFKKSYALINVGQLEALDAGSEVSPELLCGRGLVRSQGDRVKILGNGSLSKALTVKAHGFSLKAKEKIEAAGGRVEALPYA
ncbi:MAG: 50S ribosomal protein L15 [Deltaproteobacteria bacterium]|nr:50S ribosomal protein L15 [Deltaproteobacteria bacterium]